ncbi:hypothetical protein PENTCL1PPCAC_6064, partial [Pristionchus entomophagus]
ISTVFLHFCSCFLFTMETYAEVYDKPGVSLSKPLRIGEYSCHANFKVDSNASNLRYLIHVDDDFKPNFNLDAGFKNHIAKNLKDNHNDLIQIQKWAISQWDHCYDYNKVFHKAEIVCGRGTLTDIAQTPYQEEDAWRMVAVRHNGITYVSNRRRFTPPESQKDAHCAYWGHKFHKVMTSTSSNLEGVKLGKSDNYEVVDCRETYSAVYRTDIIKPDGDRIKLAYYSKIKAIDEKDNYVDFKTHAGHLSNDFWHKKAWFWWLQCHFASVDRVYTGIRSDIGIVHKIQIVERNFLRLKGGKRCDIVLNFLATVLSEVKKRCEDTLQISYSPETRRVHFSTAKRDTDFLIRDFLKTW